MSSSEELDTERPHTVQTKMYLRRAKYGGPEGLFSGLLALFPPLSSQSPRAVALMKTNARNQFSASSFHLVGARLCTSISTGVLTEVQRALPKQRQTHQHVAEQLEAVATVRSSKH